MRSPRRTHVPQNEHVSEIVPLGRPTFPSAGPLAEGYVRSEVDDFVGEVRRALKQDPPGMAPYEVEDARFHVVRRGKGYAMRAVDDYLDEARALLRERHGHDAVADIAGREPEVHHFSTTWVYALALLAIVTIIVGVIVIL